MNIKNIETPALIIDYNVFKSNIEKEKQEAVKKEPAKELEVDPSEEKVEFVMSLPEFEDYIAEPIKAPEAEEKAEEVVEKAPEEVKKTTRKKAEPKTEETDGEVKPKTTRKRTTKKTEENSDKTEK